MPWPPSPSRSTSSNGPSLVGSPASNATLTPFARRRCDFQSRNVSSGRSDGRQRSPGEEAGGEASDALNRLAGVEDVERVEDLFDAPVDLRHHRAGLQLQPAL